MILKNNFRKIPKQYSSYNIKNINSGASQKEFYRIDNKKYSFILIDYIEDRKEFNNHLKVYNILKNIDISIPKIIEIDKKNLTIITEDYGDLRFDKILSKYPLKEILKHAVETLIILKNSINYKKNIFKNYSFEIFKNEILELPEYYFPYININNKKIKEEFIFLWSESFQRYKFNFKNFVHKDFNINNLILLPSKKNHLKCGVIDFQSSFWGESCWDLFSLLEDSRILFSSENNEYFIKYFFSKTKQITSLEEFRSKFNFLNASRQTRLLGRWIKLSREKKNNSYLNFIPKTKQRLENSIFLIDDIKLNNFYNKYIL